VASRRSDASCCWCCSDAAGMLSMPLHLLLPRAALLGAQGGGGDGRRLAAGGGWRVSCLSRLLILCVYAHACVRGGWDVCRQVNNLAEAETLIENGQKKLASLEHPDPYRCLTLLTVLCLSSVTCVLSQVLRCA